MKILVVDDQKINLVLMESLLKNYDFDTIYETNSITASHAIEQQNFDLLITDYYMPDLDGLSLIQIARSKDKNIYSIVISGEYKEIFNLANDILIKPFTKSDFDKSINKFLCVKNKKSLNRY